MKKSLTYKYFKSSDTSTHINHQKTKGAIQLSDERLNPSLKNPDYLILCERKRLFLRWIEEFDHEELVVLDVGGRIQPYRPMLEKRLKKYFAIDPQVTILVDAIAVGEYLPFKDESIDLALCTQMLSYASDPFKVIAEIHRVLRPGGAFILSVPTFFPRHHDERWRFMPEGLEILMSSFSHTEIAPEGYSISGLFRTANVCINIFAKNWLLRKIVTSIVIPANNICGRMFDRFSRNNNQLTANYSTMAIK